MLNADDVLQLYEGWKNALANANVKALDVICDTNFMHTTAAGRLQTRAQVLDGAAAGDIVYESWTSTEERVRFYGSTAVLTCFDELRVITGGLVQTLQQRSIAVFFHKDGSAWKLAGVQSTPVSAGDP